MLGWIDPLGLARWNKHRKNRQFAKKPGPQKKKCKSAHANSHESTDAQHGYEIYDSHAGGTVAKTGISSGPIKSDGKSARAEAQVSAWNNEPGNEGRYSSEVVKKIPAGEGARQKILDWEKTNADLHRGTLDPARHTYP